MFSPLFFPEIGFILVLNQFVLEVISVTLKLHTSPTAECKSNPRVPYGKEIMLMLRYFKLLERWLNLCVLKRPEKFSGVEYIY